MGYTCMFCKEELNVSTKHSTYRTLYHLGCWNSFSNRRRKQDLKEAEFEENVWLDQFKINWIGWASVHTEWIEDLTLMRNE